jgi:signal transduction histidine kinase
MTRAVSIIGDVDLALYVLAAIHAARIALRMGSRAGAWAAATFGALAVVVVVGRLLPTHPHGGDVAVQRLLIVLLVLFPYLLYRFTTAFEPAAQRSARLLGVLTAAMAVWTIALPHFPASGEHRSADFTAYLVAFVIHWSVFTIVSAVRLWRAGRGQPSVAQRRMRLLSVAVVVITVALYTAVPGRGQGSVVNLVGSLLSTLSALLFVLALDPPPGLRVLWRRPEQARMQQAIVGLLSAEDEAEVAAGVLPAMARLVGAGSATLVDAGGATIGSYGPVVAGAPLRVPVGAASLHVWPGPTTPFFGTDELSLLETLGSLTALALDRARLLGEERSVRAQLERADELKSQFVAYAAHELRTPIAAVVGLAETLEQRGHELEPAMRDELLSALGGQAARLRELVEQLLDLSRLDADAVEIRPEAVDVRAFAESVVRTVAGTHEEVAVKVEAGLRAEVDPAALRLILTNLLTNALRYGRPPIAVVAETDGGALRLAVEDAGAGVEPEFVPQLFERFARSEQSREVAGGSGLGLAIARAYARAHDGELAYAATTGGGARFELVLPRPDEGEGGRSGGRRLATGTDRTPTPI